MKAEIWVAEFGNETGVFIKPIDDDGTELFLAWPSEAECVRGIEEQKRKWATDGEWDTLRPRLLATYDA